MKNKVLIGGALLCVLAPAGAARAEGGEPFRLQQLVGSDDVTIKGSERIRYESFNNNFRASGPKGADLLTFRTSIEAEYRGNGFRIGGELRDVRGYLDDKSTPISASDIDPLEAVQLYVGVGLGESFGKGTKAEITAGRMLLNFGSKRLVGDPGFLSTANSFTGIRFDWTGRHKQSVTLFYTMPDQRLPDTKQGLLDNKVVWDHEGTDLRFWGAFTSFPKGIFGLSTEAYLYGLDEDDWAGHATRNRHIMTPGFRVYSKKQVRHLDTEIEAAYQFGSIRASTAANAARLDVSAYTVHGEVGYTIAAPWSPRVALLADVASGDHAGSHSYNRFDALYGPRFGDWGPPGLFGPLARNNIVAAGAKIEIKPSSRFDLMLQAHDLWLDSATDSFAKTGTVDAAGRSGRHAGAQIDGRLRYWVLPKQVEIDLGGAVLAKGHFLTAAPNRSPYGDAYHGYADLIVSF